MDRYTISVLVPVLGRPHRVAPLVESVRAAAKATPCLTVFLCSPGDDAQIEACHAAEADSDGDVTCYVVPFPNGPGDYMRKINYGVKMTDTPFVFTAADDLEFIPGWAEHALAVHMETGACVVGTNDLANATTQKGEGSTHTLFCREYTECGVIDSPDSGNILCELYAHNFCDTEAVATAKFRQTYAHAPHSIVRHNHFLWGTAPNDATYQLGQSGFERDRALFQKRKHLWSAPPGRRQGRRG